LVLIVVVLAAKAAEPGCSPVIPPATVPVQCRARLYGLKSGLLGAKPEGVALTQQTYRKTACLGWLGQRREFACWRLDVIMLADSLTATDNRAIHV
jgi:hypothetical protein